MKETYYHPEVYFLLLRDSDQRVRVEYVDSSACFDVPLIGPRPPYYMHPEYVPYYPVI